MKKWLLFTLLLSACSGLENSTSQQKDLFKSPTGIVGGTEVSYKDPLAKKVLNFQGIYDRQETTQGNQRYISWNIIQCTASAISPRIILTAAHCISDDVKEYQISIQRNDGTIQNIPASKIEIHPAYKIDYHADLALVLLDISLPEEIEILSVPSKEMPIIFNKVQAAGFGKTHGRENPPAKDAGTLRTTSLQVVSFDLKKPDFAVDQTQGHGICQGDSGGPALLQVDTETYVVGVAQMVAYFEDDAKIDKCAYQGHYTNVQYYLEWINKTVNQLSQL